MMEKNWHPNLSPAGEGCDREGRDIPMIDLGAIRVHMPPGVEPLADHFDVLGLQESLKDSPRQQAVVAFTLRASYEALRDGIMEAQRQQDERSELDRQLVRTQNRLNASFTTQRATYEPKIMECLTENSSWGVPETLWVELHKNPTGIFDDRTARKYRYALVQDEFRHLAPAPYAQCYRVLEQLSTMFPVPVSADEGIDPQNVFSAIAHYSKAQGELEEKLLKLCNVDPADDVTVLDGVQAIVDLAQSLSQENARLRTELDEARKGGFIHPKRYVRHLEDTLMALGRMLGHKTFPQQGGGLPYDKQMTNYCSRLLQAVRTRMNNINAKAKKGTN